MNLQTTYEGFIHRGPQLVQDKLINGARENEVREHIRCVGDAWVQQVEATRHSLAAFGSKDNNDMGDAQVIELRDNIMRCMEMEYERIVNDVVQTFVTSMENEWKKGEKLCRRLLLYRSYEVITDDLRLDLRMFINRWIERMWLCEGAVGSRIDAPHGKILRQHLFGSIAFRSFVSEWIAEIEVKEASDDDMRKVLSLD